MRCRRCSCPIVTMNIVDLIVHAEFAKSKSEARRLVTQGAVTLDDQTVSDIDAAVALRDGVVLRVGKRRFGRIRLAGG